MLIDHLILKRRYRYVWLKCVTGCDLSKHCARCLKGPYLPAIAPGKAEFRAVEVPDGYGAYYLCAVDGSYSGHIHVAFRASPGSTLKVEDGLCDLEIRDAERIPIREDAIDPNDPNASRREYRTCRNWQFAHWLSRHGGDGDI